MMGMPTLSTEQFVSALLRQLQCLYQQKIVSSVVTLFPNHRKAHENPAIGVLLCASKDDEVVEYALSRSLSPAMIAEYKTQLPDKKLLQAKLHEFYLLNIAQAEGL